MQDVLTTPDMWAHLAGLFYVIGFAVRSQLILRLLLLGGTAAYILYYATAADMPLWSAIYWSTAMGMANLWIIAEILFSQTRFAMAADQRDLYGKFDTLNPGEFRKLAAAGTLRTCEDECVLTVENEPVHHLHFVLDGTIDIKKRGRAFNEAGGSFVGEVAYLLNRPASATVRLRPGTRYISWRHDDLHALLRRKPSIRVALDQLVNRDMAGKVARSSGNGKDRSDQPRMLLGRGYEPGEQGMRLEGAAL